jgi:hypothetical protein
MHGRNVNTAEAHRVRKSPVRALHRQGILEAVVSYCAELKADVKLPCRARPK